MVAKDVKAFHGLVEVDIPLIPGELKFTPFADFVLIDPVPRGLTAGGIAIPDGADPDPAKGKVIKVGPGRVTEDGTLIEPNVKPGDMVYLYFAYGKPVDITLGSKKYLIARCRDLVGLAE